MGYSAQAQVWKPYPTGPGHTVIGEVLVYEGLRSPQLGNRRDILVYLPPSYRKSSRRYPVLYMHDGQNLFDELPAMWGSGRLTRAWKCWLERV